MTSTTRCSRTLSTGRRPGADRVAVQGHDRRGLRGHAERGRHVHHGLLRGGAADVRDPLALFQRPVERGERARVLRRPLLGDDVALDREARGRALVQVGERHAALGLLRAAGERLRHHGRADGGGLELVRHLRERDAGEVHAVGRHPVLRQHRSRQQEQDVVRRVDRDCLAPEVGQGRDRRVRQRVDALGPRLHHRSLGENVQVGLVPLLRLDIGDVVAASNVVRARHLIGDRGLAAADRGEVDGQPLRLEQAPVKRDEEPRRIHGRNHGDVQHRLFRPGRISRTLAFEQPTVSPSARP